MTNDDDAAAAIADAFQNTDEMRQLDDFVAKARAAMENGKESVEVPTAFLRIILAELAADPLHFTAFRDAWNRCCDDLNLPAEKLPEPEAGAGGF